MILNAIIKLVKFLFGEPSIGGVIVKALVVFLLGATVIGTAGLVWESATEDVVRSNDEAKRISRCETYLREKQYGELWEYLNLYDLEGERYEVYWNAVDNRIEEIKEKQLEKLEKMEAEQIEETE